MAPRNPVAPSPAVAPRPALESRPEDPLAGTWAGFERNRDGPSSRVPAVRQPSVSTAASNADGGILVPGDLEQIPQDGVMWRTEELTALGIGRRTIKRLTRAGALIPVRRGCYVRGTHWKGLDDTGKSRLRVLAYAHRTLTSSTGNHTFSHTSSARLRGLYLWKVDESIHLTLPFLPSSAGHAADVVRHTRALGPADVETLHGLRVTWLERTAIDCGLLLNYHQGLIVMDHALRLGADRGKMDAHCATLPGRRGVAGLRRILANADGRSESPGETLTRDLIRKLRLPLPEPQVVVPTPIGRSRLDFAWPDRKVGLEFDGEGKYFDYRPTAEVLFQERRREKALTEMGWTFLRIEWADLFKEQEFKARVLRALRR